MASARLQHFDTLQQFIDGSFQHWCSFSVIHTSDRLLRSHICACVRLVFTQPLRVVTPTFVINMSKETKFANRTCVMRIHNQVQPIGYLSEFSF